MIRENLREVETHLNRVRKICKFLSVLLLIVLIFVSLWWGISSICMVLSLAGFDSLQINTDTDLIGLLSYIIHGIVAIPILFIMFQIFSETAKGHSPFTEKQVRRLRIIAFLLLLYGISDFLVSYNADFLHFNGFTSIDPSMAGAALVLNLAPFACALAIYAFSFVFKYGVLLQEESDTTI